MSLETNIVEYNSNYDFSKIKEFDHIIHFSSIGELNSINYLVENLLTKKIILSIKYTKVKIQ